MVNSEIDRRVDLVKKGMDKLDAVEKDLKKMGPDNSSYNAEGKVIQESWTKTGLEAFNKVKQKVEKLKKAIDTALESNDYQSLEQAVK